MATDFTVSWFQNYYGQGFSWIVPIVALAVILIFRKWLRAQYGVFLVAYSGIFFILYFFPITAYVIAEFCVGQNVYWRMLWLFQAGVIIAYAGGLFYEKAKGVWKFNVAMIACLVVILSGTFIYGKGQYYIAENPYKIPQDVLGACDIIREQADEEHPLAAGDYDFACYARVYDADIQMPYGRNNTSLNEETSKRLHDEFLKGADMDFKKICDYSLEIGVDFLVVPKEGDRQVFREGGYRIAGETERYVVYGI